ncbi:Por secretion system C-terminal sorting domain-containing protein [Gracilimonas mengyeensis]|uniref:Endoglucanase n=2 Tax=Gracilimonas mengyeensis TaxID=1302730 RepID=A0A521F6C2_9BACT|nr:Por secretion system C-terminal sorting domain-containing protein [Gracilimonas mengyeensis]
MIALLLSIIVVPNLFAQSANLTPKSNQIGYYPESDKIAIVPENEASKFHLRDVETGGVVYWGVLGASEEYSLSGETVKVADFSDFETPGSYSLWVDGGSRSYEFEIKNGVYEELSKGLTKALYYNRASVPLLQTYAGKWARQAGHPDDEVIIHPSAASEGRPANSTISSPGGWYDAGDFNKYVVPISSSISHMLLAYEQFPDYFETQTLNIPESSNTMPDVLDEALFALRWLLTMQDPGDGGVYHKLTHAGFQGNVMPHQATAPRYVVQKSTPATLDFAAVMAQAARVYEPMLPEFADSALTAAEDAWQWAQEKPEVAYKQGSTDNPAPGTINYEFDPDISTGEYGGSDFSDERFWATSELYITTGEDSYYDAGGWSNTGVSGWGNVQALGLFSLLQNRTNLTAVAQSDTAAMKQALVSAFDWYVGAGENSPYRSPFGIESWQFSWGSNGGAGNIGMSMLMLYQTTGNEKYYEAAIDVMDYLMGRNAIAYSYVTGFGEQSPMHIHHRQSEGDNVREPVPGWVAGGANPYNQSQDCGESAYNSDLPALSYLDAYCSYSTNEITTYWNSPFIYMTAALEAMTSDYQYQPEKTLAFTAPSADSLYEPGSTIDLVWNAENVSTVNLSYKMFDDEEFTEIASGIDASAGSYTGIDIPELPGDSLVFRIQDAEDDTFEAWSAVVRIKPGRTISDVTVLAQFDFYPDSRLSIRWEAVQIDSIDLLYRLASQEEYSIIASGLDVNLDYYANFWVPDAPGDSLIVRVRDTHDHNIYFDTEPQLILGTVSNEGEDGVPESFALSQNYPNPFNPATVIHYQLAKSGQVQLQVFDVSGRKIADLVNEHKTAGNYSVQFDASHLSTGVYFYRLTAGDFSSTQKMLLIK